MPDIRAVACDILNKCEHAGQYSNIALDTALERGDFSPADRALLTVLVYGVIERKLTLDHRIAALAARPADKIDPPTRTLLRLGLYQLAFLNRIPDHAAVHATVELAPRRTKGFVNALLRAFLREGKRMPYPERETDPIGYLSVRYSFAPALCSRFVAELGMSRTESLFAAFEKQPPLTLRVNTLRTTREELTERLRQAGYDPTPTPESRTGILLPAAPVRSLPGFEEGDFFIQDEASQLCVEALDAHAGMRVLDCCACPGSKSFGAAIEMQNSGEILSSDLHKNKLSLILSGAERLGITCIRTQVRDARELCPEHLDSFDRVLCDVPCSGFGVFAKKPELRYKDPAESAALPAIQREILKTASAYVKPLGCLVYSTCTLLPDENQRNIEAFLAEHGEFTLLRMRTLAPDTDGTDGFFFAVLRRQAE